MNRLVGGDRYDVAALVCVVVGVVLAITVGPWYLWLLVGFGAGNLVSAALRRRAGVPDRSALGRLRGGAPHRAESEAGGSGRGPGATPAPRAELTARPDRPPARPRVGRAGTEWREGRRRSR
jgi:hypothetical protein